MPERIRRVEFTETETKRVWRNPLPVGFDTPVKNSGYSTNGSLSMEFKMAWMYILQCSDGSYYVGSTVDLEKRVYEHNEGIGAKYTARRRPVKLVYAAEFASIAEAYVREKQVQGWGRNKREALIRGAYDALPGLAKKDFAKYKANKANDEALVE